jgi:tRNA/rRNA methyltransferase
MGSLEASSTRTPGVALDAVRIVLVSPSHPGNVGSTARAMKTMGLSRLSLVTPRFADVLTLPDTIALSSGAADILESAQIFPSLGQALGDCHWAVAVTARSRDLAPLQMSPREVAERAVANGIGQIRTALVFGSERYGLENQDVMQCQALCTIPTIAAYGSLNLAMAVQIMAYECRLAAIGAPTPSSDNLPHDLSTEMEREQLFEHLQEALIALEFLDSRHPTKLVAKLRRLFSRTLLEHDEVSILRGICSAILSPRR